MKWCDEREGEREKEGAARPLHKEEAAKKSTDLLTVPVDVTACVALRLS